MNPEFNFSQLSEVVRMILDFLLNVPGTYDNSGVVETLELSAAQQKEIIRDEWALLLEKEVIITTDHSFVVNPSLVSDVKLHLEQHLMETGKTRELITEYFQTQLQQDRGELTLFANLMSKTYTLDDVERVVFSEYDWPSELISFCDELTERGIVFKVSSSSRKHDYKSYYLRNWPFDSGQVLRDTIFRHMDVEGLTDDELKVLLVLLLGRDLKLRYEILERNMGLPDPQLRELVTNLKGRGLLNEVAGYVSVSKHLVDPLSKYFKNTVYPVFRDKVVEQLERTIAGSLSNLWLFTSAKRINELDVGDIKSELFPLKLVDKSSIPQFELQFHDMTRLGLVFDLDDKILIIMDVLKDIENWLKNSINMSIIFIPAKDAFFARSVLQDLFSKCETYVKIQDAYLGEETFDILEYIPKKLKIQLLGGIKPGSGEDPNKLCQRIERFKSERKDKFEIYFVANAKGATPFHDRFIISENSCWTTGTSLKEIGKGKSTSLTELPKDKGGETIELAFDRVWFADPKDLEQAGYDKLNLEAWKSKVLPTK